MIIPPAVLTVGAVVALLLLVGTATGRVLLKRAAIVLGAIAVIVMAAFDGHSPL